MKTNEINQNTLGNALIMAMGVAGGVALSGSLNSLAKEYIPTGAGDEIGQVGVAGLGILGGAYIKPSSKKDKMGQALRALSIGVAAKSTYDLVTNAVKPSVNVKPAEDQTILDKALYGAIGLGCACQGNTQSGMNASLPVFPKIEFTEVEEDQENKEIASLMGEIEEIEAASLL